MVVLPLQEHGKKIHISGYRVLYFNYNETFKEFRPTGLWPDSESGLLLFCISLKNLSVSGTTFKFPKANFIVFSSVKHRLNVGS